MSGRVIQATGTRPSRATAIDLPSVVTETDVQKPGFLVTILGKLIDAVRTLLGLARPDYDEFEDRAAPAGGTMQFPHRFPGRVRWTIVDWEGAAAWSFRKDASTSKDVLVLYSAVAGTVTVRVEPVV